MIVEFQNAFIVPGFGRSRFQAGIVRDVPVSMRGKLPKSAKILPDDTPTDDQLAQDEDLRAAQDFANAQLDTSDEALEKAGFAGWVNEDTPQEASAPWMFADKEYKTEAAMKAAVTRAKRAFKGD